MTDALATIPEPTKVNTGVANTETLADGLARALSDTYRLLLKTHVYHWNVEGPLFFGIHTLTEDQYGDLFAATDVLAERIRALGQLAPMSVASLLRGAEIGEIPDAPSAQQMVDDLVHDHEALAAQLHMLITLAGKHGDDVTADLATERAGFHEKSAWMLRAIAKS